MSWKSTKEAIRVAALTGAGMRASSKAADWNTRPTPFGNKVITLNVLPGDGQDGPDRVVEVWNDANQSFDVSVSAVVVFTASFRCEDIKGDSLELCELVRSHFALPSTRSELKALGVTVVGIPSKAMPVMGYSIDQRDVSAYTFELQFRHELHRADPTPIAPIEHVRISGTADGKPVDISIDSA